MPSAPPPRRTRSAARSAGRSSRRGLPAAWLRVPPDQRQRLLRAGLVIVGVPAVIAVIGVIVLWVSYGRIIDSRLGGEQQPIPRIFARPFEIKAGDALSPTQLAQRLDDIGYARRPEPEQPGQFSVLANAILLIPRATDEQPARPIQIEFSKGAAPVVATMTVATPQGAAVPAKAAPETRSGRAAATGPAASRGGRGAAGRRGAPAPERVDRVMLEAPLLAALAPGQKRRATPLASIPQSMIDAVVAIEDRRFFEHPGVDPIGAVGALITNLRGNKPYLVGGSTLTQQIVKNTFLTPAKTLRRKLQEQFMALVLESRFTKRQILELYLNDVTLGQRGPFEIHGVSEAARIFFGKDVSNLTLAESATIAGLIQSPSRLSPFRHLEQARERRDLVLREMAGGGFITADAARRASAEPLKIAARALENEAPYFVDFVSQQIDHDYAGLLKKSSAVDVYTTLDVQTQRLAQEALAEGLVQVDKQLAARRRKGVAEAALVALDPRTGEILAYVGGRAYNQSQYDRVVSARRQPGSAFKPFVYLAAFEKMADEGRADLTPATVITDEPTTFKDGQDQDYTPANYQNEYGGPVTLRDALAHSRNIVAIKVAEQIGYDRVAAFWKRIDPESDAKPYPSIALGVFEATPLEMATAYTIFPNGGAVRPLQAVTRIVQDGKPKQVSPGAPRSVARASTTFLVLNMMRSVLNEGTAAGARAAGFSVDAAGKTGTTNDQRDAWFIGFTPELLTAVWVGLDGNQPLGLTGSQAALPIWTSFMKRALAGHGDRRFVAPPDITFVQIDKTNGKLATPLCPSVIDEAFLPGTEPEDTCDIHGGSNGFKDFFSRFGSVLGRIVR
jgi:penicillin-binding protein 1B